MKSTLVWTFFACMACVSADSWFSDLSSFSNNQQSVMTNGPIAVISTNGKTHYEIEGKNIDLKRAKVLEENDDYKVMSPVEVQGVKVTMYKNTNRVALDYKGNHIESSN